MSEDSMPRCDYPGCDADGSTVSRLSPEGYLVATGKKAGVDICPWLVVNKPSLEIRFELM